MNKVIIGLFIAGSAYLLNINIKNKKAIASVTAKSSEMEATWYPN